MPDGLAGTLVEPAEVAIGLGAPLAKIDAVPLVMLERAGDFAGDEVDGLDPIRKVRIDDRDDLVDKRLAARISGREDVLIRPDR